MNINLKFYIFLFSLFFSISNIHVKPIKANENVSKVKEALGFMIWGDGGWASFSSFHEVQGCKVTYHQTFMKRHLREFNGTDNRTSTAAGYCSTQSR
ncbi:hypothetical protein OAS23_02815 [Alphaproteobacteria bacterium]|nr:hypothetical protein [Alphaproteobacteria bacterium]